MLGDSPGGLFTAAHLNRVYDAVGRRQGEQAGAALNLDTAQTEAHAPEAVQARTFTYTRWLDDADAIIDFCKLKTHGMLRDDERRAKTYFGVIPGTMKPEYHCKYPQTADFCGHAGRPLRRISSRVSCLCDAVVRQWRATARRRARPREVGAILAAESAHKLDLAGGQAFIGLTAEDVPTLARRARVGA